MSVSVSVFCVIDVIYGYLIGPHNTWCITILYHEVFMYYLLGRIIKAGDLDLDFWVPELYFRWYFDDWLRHDIKNYVI